MGDVHPLWEIRLYNGLLQWTHQNIKVHLYSLNFRTGREGFTHSVPDDMRCMVLNLACKIYIDEIPHIGENHVWSHLPKSIFRYDRRLGAKIVWS